MHQLGDTYNSDEFLSSTIRDLNERVRGNKCKLGLILDLKPFWEVAHRFERSGLDPITGFRGPFPGFWFEPAFELTGDTMSEPIDLSRDYDHVRYVTDEAFGTKKKNTPYLLRLYARPTTDASMFEMRQALLKAARKTDIATVVETHAPGLLLSSVGDEIHQISGKPGTLGGYVTDTGTGEEFAMTCGHVLDNSTSVAPFLDKHGTQVGVPNAQDRIVPTAHPAGTTCDVNCATATDLDIALVDVSGSGASNLAIGIDAVVAKRDVVTMHGANGRETYEIGPWVVDLEIGGRCFVRLIQFHAPVSNSMLHRSVPVATTRLPSGGDSGSWLLNNGNEWNGVEWWWPRIIFTATLWPLLLCFRQQEQQLAATWPFCNFAYAPGEKIPCSLRQHVAPRGARAAELGTAGLRPRPTGADQGRCDRRWPFCIELLLTAHVHVLSSEQNGSS